VPWRNGPEDRARDAVTYGPEYRRNRAAAKRRANGRCEGCHHAHLRLQCDHIQNTAALGRPDHSLGNLQMLCTGPGSCQCHEKKTAREGGGWRQAKTAADPPHQARTQW
jgi:hypothetical protein